jgi:hypothetical protein
MPRRHESFERNWQELHAGRCGSWVVADSWRRQIQFLVRVIDDWSCSDQVEVHVHSVQRVEEVQEPSGKVSCVFHLSPRLKDAWVLPQEGLLQSLGTCIKITGSRVARVRWPPANSASDTTCVNQPQPRAYMPREIEPAKVTWMPEREMQRRRLHDDLTNRAAECLSDAGWKVEEGIGSTVMFDLIAQKGGNAWLLEAKPSASDDEMRTAVGQLLQYRYQYVQTWCERQIPKLAVLLDKHPPSQEWIDILAELSISVFLMTDDGLQSWTEFSPSPA